MKDAYDRLFSNYKKEDFFKHALEAIIFVEPDNERTTKNWKEQKEKLMNNEEIFIRGYGRDAKGTDAFKILYKELFNNSNIKKDATNNAIPTRILTQLTGFSKTVKSDKEGKMRIQNYQVSHLFGRTKNPLLFSAAWNIAYIPKYIDPFTGHETQGGHKIDFQKMFNDKISSKFKNYINDYNMFISKKVEPYLEDALAFTKQKHQMDGKSFKKFERDVRKELSRIE